MTPITAAAFAGGFLLAAIITFLWVSRSCKRDMQVRLDVLNRQIDTEQQAFTAEQIEKASLNEKLTARIENIRALEDRLAELDRRLTEERAGAVASKEEISRLQASLSERQRQSEEKLQLLLEARTSLQDGFRSLANEIFEARQNEFKRQSHEQLSAVLDPLRERISDFEKRVEQTYNDEARQRFSLIREVKNLQALNSSMAEDAVNLTKALKGESKTQGIWGEVVLERVLEKSGLEKGREYDTQVTLKNDLGQRMQPDAIVRLPEGKDVVVDAKVSLTAYERYCSADDEADSSIALNAHIASLRAHVRQLSEKDYQALEGIRTLDFVLLFVPIEAAFSAAVTQDADLFTEAFDRNIVIVAPSTLLATLRTIQNIWRYEQQNKNAQEIANRAGALYDKFVNFVGDLETIGSRLESTQNAYEDAYNKLTHGRGNLVKRAEDMKALGARVSKSLPPNLVEMRQRDSSGTVTSVDK